jgi:hypothetical protein
MGDFDLGNFFWNSNEVHSFLKEGGKKVRISSMTELAGRYSRVGKNLLIRKSDSTFWKLDQDENGSYIERIVGEGE